MDQNFRASVKRRCPYGRHAARSALFAIAMVVLAAIANNSFAQSGSRDPIPQIPARERAPDISATTTNVDRDDSNLIADVVFKGNRVVPDYHLARNIGTRPGRYFDPDQLQQDVDKLWRLPAIKRVNGPFIDKTPAGVVITFEIVEKKHIRRLEFIGNRGITDRALKKKSELDVDQPLDLHEIQMARNRIEEFYRAKGYTNTEIEIQNVEEVENGNVVFLIHEDQQQRIWGVQFVGNTFVSDARLKHFIESKPGILKVIGGVVNEQEIERDILRLESYYKSFGYFNARIGREISKSNGGRWLTIRYVIDEGPRYKIRNVSFAGNQTFTTEQLNRLVELKPENGVMPDFNVSKMNLDVVSLRDLYGSQGYIFSSVEAEPRFLEQPGSIDLVYRIVEGEQYRVGEINLHIQGDVSVTKREVAMNYLSLKPGDLIDAREMRNSERRLSASQLFAGPNAGPGRTPPRIVVQPPDLSEIERIASQGSSSRESTDGSSSRYR